MSHAHGWSTGPTNLLSRYIAGIQLVGAAGQTWKIAPAPGDLTTVSSGLSTVLGSFAVNITADGQGGITAFSFEVPAGTSGDVILPNGTTGSLTSGGRSSGPAVALIDGTAAGVKGGLWSLVAS